MVVTNVDQINRTVQIPPQAAVAQLDPEYLEAMAELREALVDLKESNEDKSSVAAQQMQENVRQLEERIEELVAKQARREENSDSRIASELTDRSNPEIEDLPYDSSSASELMEKWNRTRLIVNSRYKLPDEVKGYRRFAPRYIKDPECPNTQIWENTYPKIGFRFTDLAQEQLISPLIVSIARVNAPLKLYQVFYEQYRYEPGNNSLELDVNLQPAKYQLEFGYYVKREVNEEFPKFYAFECEFEVIKRG